MSETAAAERNHIKGQSTKFVLVLRKDPSVRRNFNCTNIQISPQVTTKIVVRKQALRRAQSKASDTLDFSIPVCD